MTATAGRTRTILVTMRSGNALTLNEHLQQLQQEHRVDLDTALRLAWEGSAA